MRFLMYIAVASGWALLIAAYISLKPLLDASDRIDLCSDDSSPAYIRNEAARAAACN
ncbi:hypothetical protein [Agrobacterium sp. NPDC089420]|uniref:hypothetical protein n=1 Tax=Agrobacterium sp. NPDC089420 TaxID=3363918 RepID=UPI00384B6554